MKRTFSIMLIILLAITVVFPTSISVFAQEKTYADGEYQVQLDVLHATKSEKSIMSNYIKSPAQLLVKNGKNIVTLTLTDQDLIKDFSVEQKSAEIVRVNKADNTRDVTFEIDRLDAVVNAKVKVHVAAANYTGEYAVRLFFDENSVRKVEIDNTAPKVTGVSNNKYYNKDVKITFNEGTATLNKRAFESGTVVKAAGVYTLVVTDEAGNKTTVKFTIDKTAPKVTGVSNNKYYNKDVKITFNEGTATLNKKAFKTGAVVKAAGAHTLVVTDKAGNKSTVKFTIDKTTPKVTGVTNNKYYNKDVKITFNEGTATLNKKAFKSGTVVKASGTHALVVTDKAGNKTTVKFTIDKLPPAPPKVKTIKSTSKVVTGTTEPHAKITVKVKSKTLGSAAANSKGTYKISIPTQKKKTTLTITAKDRAGNNSKATKTTVK